MPPRLVGRLGLEEKAPEPPTSPDPSMQMIWSVSAEEKLDLEASTEKPEKVPDKTAEQKKDTASEKAGTPKTEQKAKKKDTASEKAGTPKTEQKAKKKDTASEKVGTPKTDLKDKITALPKIPKKTPQKLSVHEIWLTRREYKAVTTQGDQSKDERDKAERDYIKERVKGLAGAPKVKTVQAAKDQKSFKVKIELAQKYPLKHMIPIWKEDAEFQIREHVTPVESNKTQKEK